MKRVLLILGILIVIFGTVVTYATDIANENNTIGELTEIKQNAEQELEEYTEKYGSETYGLTAYILSKVQLYSIPFCFLGIAFGAIYQYVIGIRRLDIRDRGFMVVIAFITILIICQVLPLIFALIVKGWRG